MATKIRLMRLGKIRAPYYRIVVADSRTKRDGRAIETIGRYHPKEHPSLIEVDSDRVQHWLRVGAQPTEPVAAILRKTGDWQKFRGEAAPEPLQQPASRPDRKAVFEQAAREAAGLTEPAADRKDADRKDRTAKKAATAEAPAEPVEQTTGASETATASGEDA